MKTHVTKNNKSGKSSGILLFVSVILFSGVLILVPSFSQTKFWDDSAETQFNQPEMVQENYLLSNQIPRVKEIVLDEKPAGYSEMGQLMAKMEEYLAPIEETKLEIFMISGLFAEEPFSEKEPNCYSKNEYIENLGKLKADSVLEYYAWQKRLTQYLTVENETPLEIENWMIDEKCWCPELREPMPLTLNTSGVEKK